MRDYHGRVVQIDCSEPGDFARGHREARMQAAAIAAGADAELAAVREQLRLAIMEQAVTEAALNEANEKLVAARDWISRAHTTDCAVTTWTKPFPSGPEDCTCGRAALLASD
jgi:hypothetical protein